jgi:hypothetical protein
VFPDTERRDAVLHIYRFGSLDTYKSNTFGADNSVDESRRYEDIKLKTLEDKSNVELNALYRSLVKTNVLSPQEFWHTHRDALIKTILGQPKVRNTCEPLTYLLLGHSAAALQVGLHNEDVSFHALKSQNGLHISVELQSQVFLKQPKVKQAHEM